ncbi:Low temperature requirement protein LtrA [Asanoa hainanensis]|uniref:Low temperature requirement protein LtrA n=1 Tax=Asanoa hainanensis TaxID=560556 RepID=A0A239L9R2_9ACTN|nr:Low temperature requirement protein LtrA [Asanoa hainanensis]
MLFGDPARRSANLELFFDLVVAVAVSQAARLLRLDPTWHGAGLLVLVFVPLWWAWIGFTFYDNRYTVDDAIHRVSVLAAAIGMGTLGLSLTRVPGPGVVVLGLAYVFIRLILIGLYMRARRSEPRARGQAGGYALGFGLAVLLWAAGTPLPPGIRLAVWAVAVGVDLATSVLIERRVGLLPVDADHLVDRFAAFFIIVLGESIITTGGLAADAVRRWNFQPVVTLICTAVLACAVWWGYFDRRARELRAGGLRSSDAGWNAALVYAYGHFPIVLGVVGIGVGAQLAVLEAAGVAAGPARVVAASGLALYLLGLNLLTLLGRVPLADSLLVERTGLVAILVVIAVVGPAGPAAGLAALIAVALAHVLLNVYRGRRSSLVRPQGSIVG